MVDTISNKFWNEVYSSQVQSVKSLRSTTKTVCLAFDLSAEVVGENFIEDVICTHVCARTCACMHMYCTFCGSRS